MIKKRIIWAVVVVALLAAIGVYFFSGWSRINCWTREIDINTGRTRYTRYWFWIVTNQEISPTWMSELLNEPDENTTPDWHLVVTLSPGSHSPYYAFHRATAELITAELTFAMYDIPQDRRLALAKAVRDSWKRTGSDDEASELIAKLSDEARDGKYPEK